MTASPLIRQAVVDTVSRLCRALDERDWVAMRLCLADTLATDYSRLRGTPPARLTAEEFVRLRQSGLAGLRTQHLCFNHLVALKAGGRIVAAISLFTAGLCRPMIIVSFTLTATITMV